MLDKRHIKAINSVRAILQSLEQARLKDGQDSEAEGRFAEACRAADEALVNVLVIAQIWLGEEITAKDLQG